MKLEASSILLKDWYSTLVLLISIDLIFQHLISPLCSLVTLAEWVLKCISKDRFIVISFD